MRSLLLLGGLALIAAACDGIPQFSRTEAGPDPRLALSLDVSEELDWGGVSSIRLTLSNDGETVSENAHVELYLPSWLEFSSVEPEGTEVALLSASPETRLAYRLGDPALEPGETRTIVQRVRVPPRDATAGPSTDAQQGGAEATPDARPPVPANRTLRARLVSPSGEQLGAEVRTAMPFRGADNSAALPAGGTADAGAKALIRSDGVGPVRLGATAAELRAAVPAARDTTFTIGAGPAERGLSVPLDGSRVLAVLANDRVDRIIVRDAGIRTELGHGVGSTFQQLRQVYGTACTARTPDGRAAAWFSNLPGVSFALDALPATPGDTTAAPSLADAAQVRELWVRRGSDRC
jgi:hypothetical protein